MMEQVEFDHGDILRGQDGKLCSLQSLQVSHAHSTSELSGASGHLDVLRLVSKARHNQRATVGVVVPKSTTVSVMQCIPLSQMNGLHKLATAPASRDSTDCLHHISPTVVEQEEQYIAACSLVMGRCAEYATYRENFGIFKEQALLDGRSWASKDMRWKRPKILMEVCG